MNGIAQTTLNQLGGANRLAAMIGASNFSHNKEGALTFQFKGCQTSNIIHIQLNEMDTYNIKFYKLNKRSMLTVAKQIDGIYADRLKKVIEEYTGLYLSL